MGRERAMQCEPGQPPESSDPDHETGTRPPPSPTVPEGRRCRNPPGPKKRDPTRPHACDSMLLWVACTLARFSATDPGHCAPEPSRPTGERAVKRQPAQRRRCSTPRVARASRFSAAVTMQRHAMQRQRDGEKGDRRTATPGTRALARAFSALVLVAAAICCLLPGSAPHDATTSDAGYGGILLANAQGQ